MDTDVSNICPQSAEPRPIDTYLTLTPLSEFRSGPLTSSSRVDGAKFKPGEPFYDRLSMDKPGEELSHDATVWKLYRNEAEEYDQELVKGRHASLDVLLLFVGFIVFS